MRPGWRSSQDRVVVVRSAGVSHPESATTPTGSPALSPMSIQSAPCDAPSRPAAPLPGPRPGKGTSVEWCLSAPYSCHDGRTGIGVLRSPGLFGPPGPAAAPVVVLSGGPARSRYTHLRLARYATRRRDSHHGMARRAGRGEAKVPGAHRYVQTLMPRLLPWWTRMLSTRTSTCARSRPPFALGDAPVRGIPPGRMTT
jgi:hypothetical protein